MASTPQAFWQTLLAATSQLSDVLVGTTSLLDAIFKDVNPVQAALGQTIDVPVPNAVNSQTSNISGDPVFNDYTVNTVPISLTLHPQYGTKIRSFDQYTSPVTIKDVLLGPGIRAVAEQANANVAALINSTALNINPVVSTTGSAITPAQFVAGGFQVLLQNKVNVWDSTSMSLVQAPAVYANQLQSTSWTQESIVGINVAQQARVEGGIKIAYGAKQLTDQALPQTGSAGSYVYKSVYMTRYAIAGVFRPLPAGDMKVCETTYVFWKGVPIRVTLGFSVQLDSWLLNIDTGMGVAVVRPEQAVLFSTAQ